MYIISKNKVIEVDECDTFIERLIGFMFRKDKIIVGKRFPKCRSIHTFMMKQDIDIIMTDKNNRIIYMYPNFTKNKIIKKDKKIYYTYELPLGTCCNYIINDIIKIKS